MNRLSSQRGRASLAPALLALTALTFMACGTGAGASPNPRTTPPSSTPLPSSIPSPTSTPTRPAAIEVTSAARAAALVFASDARWSSMAPLRSDLIGASMWFEASEDSDGFAVRITAGSGDCQAGCIERHYWNYHVDRDGTVALAGEEGDDVGVQPGAGGDGPATVTIELKAGPVCPVEPMPADPSCAERPVANADVTLYDPHGNEVATAKSGADGRVNFRVDGGAYYVEAHAVEGLMRAPEAQAFAVLGGDQVGLLMGYDTGIR